MALFVDTHIHLQLPAYADDLSAVLERAAEAGVRACIVPGLEVESSRAALTLAERYADGPCRLYAAVGIHPTEAYRLDAAALRELRAMAAHPRVVAIGEIGLDDYWPRIPDRGWRCAEPEEQREALRRQLDLAAEVGLPVILHDREAHEAILRILAAWVEAEPPKRGVLHAYAAGPTRLDEVVALGFAVGVGGVVTRRKATAVQEVARSVAADRLLLETDGPYLTPVPYRGRRNEPAYLPLIAETIARLRGVTAEAVGTMTTANAVRLFALEGCCDGVKREREGSKVEDESERLALS